MRIVVQLNGAGSGEMIWSEGYDSALSLGGLLAAPVAPADRIAVQLGQTYVVVNTAASRMFAQGASNISTYVCVLRANEWRRAGSAPLHGLAFACLEWANTRAQFRRRLGDARLAASRCGAHEADRPRRRSMRDEGGLRRGLRHP